MIILSNTLILLVSVFLAVITLRTSKDKFIPVLFVQFFFIWSQISCYFNDLGYLNFELGRHTFNSYATSALGLFYIAFSLGLLAYDRLFKFEIESFRTLRLSSLSPLSFFGIFFLGLLLLYEFYVGVQSPELFLTDRSDSSSRSGLLNFLISFPWFLPALLSILRFITASTRLIDIFFVLYVSVLVLSGNKFSGILEAFVFYLVPVLWLKNENINFYNLFSKKIILYFFIVFFLLAILIYLNYSDVTSVGELTILDLIFSRIFLFQGHLFWSAFQDSMSLINYDHYQKELSVILQTASVEPDQLGMKFLMYQALGETAYIYIDRGFLFTMGFPAILLYMMSYHAIFLTMSFLGFLLGAIISVWKYFVVSKSLIYQLIALSIFSPFVTMLFTGNLFIFFSFTMVIKLIVVIFLMIVATRKS